MEKNNFTRVLTQFVQALNIPVTRQSVSDELEKHPDYDSLLAFSEVLSRWQVPNAAYHLTFDQLAEVPLPFITYTKSGFTVVKDLDKNQVTVTNGRWGKKTIAAEEFKKSYSGSVLVAEKETNSGEPDYEKKRKKELLNDLRMPVVFGGSIILLIGFLFMHTAYAISFNLQIALLTLFKTGGLITSVLLLMQSLDTNNPLIQKLCGGDNNKDCNAILSSKAAKISDELSWSEIGFFYFTGTWIVLLFNSNHSSLIQMLAILNIVSLPYTFYSIYYQWRVAKQWCIFCCTVQAILWLEFFAFLPSLLHGIQAPTWVEWSSLVMEMAIPVLAWILVKPYLLQAQQITPLKQQLRKFKFSTELFEKMLNDEVKYTLPADEHSLIIGNREAEKVITMVSNPYCQPCAKAHKALDEWLTHRPDVKLQVVFSTSNNEKDLKTQVAAHLMSLQASQNDVSLKKALNDWYEQKQKNYEAWAKEHPKTTAVFAADALAVQKEWCMLTEVTATPTLFLNGRRLPKSYQPEDLKYFI